MNAKALFALTLALALLSSGVAMATEATEFKDAPGTVSRAQVRSDLAHAQADGSWLRFGESYGDAQPMLASVRSRQEVRAEAHAAARAHPFVADYTGS